jgi:hypothetical protein
MATPCVLVGRIIDHFGSFRLRKGQSFVQIGHRLVGLLKTRFRQEDGEWTCHFISPGEVLFNKEICDQNQEHLLDGARDGKPSS